MTKRSYNLGQRASSQEETRRRIVDATVALHEEIGPRATTISAIAEKASVQRLTVYRHFPDETELFKACTSHWFELNPPPRRSQWAEEEGLARVYFALHQLYSYYRRTERMWTLAYRDEAEVPALAEPMRQVRAYLKSIQLDLSHHLDPKAADSVALTLTIGSAIQFATWQTLAREETSDGFLASVVCNWIRGVMAKRVEADRG